MLIDGRLLRAHPTGWNFSSTFRLLDASLRSILCCRRSLLIRGMMSRNNPSYHIAIAIPKFFLEVGLTAMPLGPILYVGFCTSKSEETEDDDIALGATIRTLLLFNR